MISASKGRSLNARCDLPVGASGVNVAKMSLPTTHSSSGRMCQMVIFLDIAKPLHEGYIDLLFVNFGDLPAIDFRVVPHSNKCPDTNSLSFKSLTVCFLDLTLWFCLLSRRFLGFLTYLFRSRLTLQLLIWRFMSGNQQQDLKHDVSPM